MIIHDHCKQSLHGHALTLCTIGFPRDTDCGHHDHLVDTNSTVFGHSPSSSRPPLTTSASALNQPGLSGRLPWYLVGPTESPHGTQQFFCLLLPNPCLPMSLHAAQACNLGSYLASLLWCASRHHEPLLLSFNIFLNSSLHWFHLAENFLCCLHFCVRISNWLFFLECIPNSRQPTDFCHS